MILDFATDIKRLDKNGNQVVFDGEGNYTTEDAVSLFEGQFKDFSLSIETSTFTEENLEDDAGYNFITGMAKEKNINQMQHQDSDER